MLYAQGPYPSQAYWQKRRARHDMAQNAEHHRQCGAGHDLPPPVRAEDAGVARAEKQIADTYGLDRVMIEPRYNMPGELSNEYIKSLYDDMAYRMPSAKGLLDHRKWAFTDGALQIPMDEVSEKHFANALRHLEARIQRELGRSCPVHAVRADAQDFAPAPEQEESREEFCTRLWSKQRSRSGTPKPKKPRPRRSSTQAISARARKRCARTTSSSAS
mgnify:CR=1 FL=1